MPNKNYRSEKDVKKEINRLLDQHHWFWWSTPMNGFGKTGISDKCAYRNNVFMAIEAKFKDNKPTHLQRAFLDSIRVEGGFGFVVNEKNINEFAWFLEAFDRAAEAVSQKKEVTPEDGALMINCIRGLTEGLS